MTDELKAEPLRIDIAREMAEIAVAELLGIGPEGDADCVAAYRAQVKGLAKRFNRMLKSNTQGQRAEE